MKFNSQICTTRKQSERLLALGLKKETADMHHSYYTRVSFDGSKSHFWKEETGYNEKAIPAWSLGRLFALGNGEDWRAEITVKDERYGIHCGYELNWYDDIFEAVIAWIEEDIKEEGVFMREIKFRAIDMGGRWVYGDLIHKRTSVGDAMIRCNNGIESDVDAASIGQFTGLYDKDGEELYEGDIIRSFDSEGNSILHHIEYRGASFVAILKDSFPLYGNIITQDWLKEFKKTIIGNIHNDKEYLEE